MKVFLSWSKPRSHEVAKAFAEFLPRVIQECEQPFVSSSIQKGDEWFGRITSELAAARVGVVFITPENQSEEWLNFEAGAMLTRVTEQQLCPVLIDLPSAEYKGPLKNLQSTAFEDKEEMRQLILDIHGLSTSTVSKNVISDTFDDRWDRFFAAANKGMSKHLTEPAQEELGRGTDDKLDEALDLLRSLTRESRLSSESHSRGGSLNRTAWRYVRKFKNGDIDLSKMSAIILNLDEGLRGEIVSLEGGGFGRIVGVDIMDGVLYAMVETKPGKGISVELTDLLEDEPSFQMANPVPGGVPLGGLTR